MIFVNNLVPLTSAGTLITLGTDAAPQRSELLIQNIGNRRVFALPYSFGETPITVSVASGFSISTGASLTLSHTNTEWAAGYVSVGLACTATSTGARVKLLAK